MSKHQRKPQPRHRRPPGERPRPGAPHRSRAALETALERADDLIDRGAAQEAIELLEPFYAFHSQSVALHECLGYARAQTGDVWGAMEAYERALASSKDPVFYTSLAALYVQVEFRAHLLRAIRQILRLREPMPDAAKMQQVATMVEQEIADLAADLGLATDRIEEGLYQMEAGEFALNRGDYAASIAASQRAIKQLRDWPPPHNNLSLALYYSGQWEKAIATLRGVLSHAPDNIHALGNAICYMVSTGQEDEARTLWPQLKAIELSNPDLRLKVAEAAAALDEDESVYQILKPLDKRDLSEELPPSLAAKAQFYLGVSEANTRRRGAGRRLESVQDRFPWAAEMVSALLAGKPGPGWASRFPYSHSSDLLTAGDMEAFVGLVGRQEELGERRFRREVERFAAQHPQVVRAAEKLIWEEGQAEGGIAMLSILGTPEAHAALRRFGLSQAGEDDLRLRALQPLAEAGQIAEREPLRVWIGGEWREIQLRQYEIGAEPGTEYAPEVAERLVAALDIYRQGDEAKAEKLFEEILAIEPRAKEACNNLGTIYAHRGEHERAREMYQQAIDIDPAYVYPRCNLAAYLLDDGDIAGAEAMTAPLSDVSRFHPQDMAFYAYTQARILVARQEYDAARETLKMALELAPDHALSRELLERLDLAQPLWEGMGSFWERQFARYKAARARLQHKLTAPDPGLAQALALYAKDALVGMARAVLPWGGWSALRKAELVRRIVDALLDADLLGDLVGDLPQEARDALGQVLASAGTMSWAAFDARYGSDLDESPYWNYHTPETVMGQLRLHGLLVETTVDGELYVAVPTELRPLLQAALH